MADVINLNRFRKRKARDEKERRAEENRRIHGRTKAERAREDAEKQRLEKKLEGAFLVRESVPLEEILGEEPDRGYEKLEKATQDVLSLREFSDRLNQERQGQKTDPNPEKE